MTDRERAMELALEAIREGWHLSIRKLKADLVADAMLEFAIEEVGRVPLACYVAERVPELRAQIGKDEDMND